MKNKFFKISLNGLEVFSKIGYHKEEQKNGNHFLINLRLKTKYSNIKDNLNATVDYQSIYECVKKIMNQKVKLIETVAENINNEILSKFAKVYSCKVKVYKINPKITGKIKSSSVVLKTKR